MNITPEAVERITSRLRSRSLEEWPIAEAELFITTSAMLRALSARVAELEAERKWQPKNLSELRDKHRSEKAILLKFTLTQCDYNQSLSARALGMDRGAFIRDYKKYCGVGVLPTPPEKG